MDMDADGSMTILKRDALGRVTLPREQREALIAEFERSGLRATQFARMAGINYGTFASWMQDRRHARGDYARSDRGEARVSPVSGVPNALGLSLPFDFGDYAALR